MPKCSNSAETPASIAPPTLTVAAAGPQRAAARCSLYRLAAVSLAHPVPETWQALNSGKLQEAIAAAWFSVHGRHWPVAKANHASAEAFEAAYIAVFLHGHGGKPGIPLLAGDHETLLSGQTRPVFMLNIGEFYRHFKLQAAVDDEGRSDEPDHLVTMLEFMAVLTHLESRALSHHRDASGYRRAQRDFLKRYLLPLAEVIARGSGRARASQLDNTILHLIEELPAWLASDATSIEAMEGPYHHTEDQSWAGAPSGERTVDQNLWG